MSSSRDSSGLRPDGPGSQMCLPVCLDDASWTGAWLRIRRERAVSSASSTFGYLLQSCQRRVDISE